MALTLPNAPRIFDADPLGQAQEGYKFGKGILDEQNAKKALALYADTLYGGQQQAPQPGASILQMMGPGQQTAVQATEQMAQPRQPGGAIMGTPDDAMSAYMASTAQSESGGSNTAKNPNSSATGKFQFLEGTWNDLARQNPDLGLTPDGRTDPAQQERAMKVFTAQNAKQLAGAGIPVNPGSLYAAHFLGGGGATQVLSQPDNTPVASLVSPEVVQANPQLAQMTVGQFKQWAAQKGGGQGGGYQAPMVGQSAPTAQLPPREVMQALFAAPATRQFAVELAKAAQEGTAPPELTSEQRNFLMSQQDPAFAEFLTGPTERDIRKGPDGVERYVDTGEPVFPDISAPVEAPDAPASVEEYNFYAEQEKAAGRAPVSFGQWKKDNAGGGGLSVQTNPDGTVSVTQGAGMPKLTEGNSKDVVYLTKGAGALPILDQFGESLTNLAESAGGQVPVVGNYLKSPEYQQAEQAGLEFLAAVLRKDTGAAVTKEESEMYGNIYLPRPGDQPNTLLQKKDARARALKAIELGIPPQAILAMEQNGIVLPDMPGAAASQPSEPANGAIPAGIDAEVWAVMTPEERALWP